MSSHTLNTTSNIYIIILYDTPFQVEWGKDMQDGEVNFFSVSADGKVCNWILMQNELAVTTVASLSMPFLRVLGPDGGLISIKGTR